MQELENTEINPIHELYTQLIECEPKPISDFVPEKQNALDQKAAFLGGDIRNPNHFYDKLDAIDFNKVSERIANIGDQILNNPYLDKKHVVVYETFIKRYQDQNRLMELAHRFKSTSDIQEKALIKDEFMAVNIELNCEPKEDTYRSLLQEKLDQINNKSLVGNSLDIKKELFDLAGYTENDNQIRTRFRPSDETIEWMHGVVDDLYGNMLSHVPDQKKFTPLELQTVFSTILKEEFEDAAEGWVVDVEPANAINVKTSEKRIVIPEDKSSLSLNNVRQLVVHEIGVHVLRSIIGSDTDLYPLAIGLNDYYEAEEGIAKVMQQALDGKFIEAGIDHYLTIGAAYYDHKDFRDIFEMGWRLKALESAEESQDISVEAINKAKNSAYNQTMRILRGTDELPWFKDLAYYNGAVDMWRYLEAIRGDDIKFMFVLMGKANPADITHERIMYETRTK